MRTILLTTLLLFALLPAPSHAALPTGTAACTQPADNPGIDWLSQVTSDMHTLLTNYSDALVDAGRKELAFFGIITLFGMVIRWILAHMNLEILPAFRLGDLLSLFLKLLIPLYVTRSLVAKFWHWIDALIVYSMFPAVAAGVTFIWVNVLEYFWTHSLCVAGATCDYSLGHWLALLPVLVMLNAATIWSVFKIPYITGIVFGGVGGQAQGFLDGAVGTIVSIAQKFL